jgi:geranylgeranyl diphosphate synthase type II
MSRLLELRETYTSHLANQDYGTNPPNLYDPIKYIMSIGGKRIRPLLVLAGMDLFAKDVQHGLDAAMAVEVFHNFSLVHDDIMDAADIRRGQATVHKKWDENTAILSGDVMLIQAYEYLQNYDKEVATDLIKEFTSMAKGVCEGQRMDMDFETSQEVEIADYIEMITLKTSILLASSLKLGAIIAGQDKQVQKHIYEFGKNLGIAFQLQDDLLDTFGTKELIGKRVGGDILQNKKTYLYLKTQELVTEETRARLIHLFDEATVTEEEQKIAEVKAIFSDVHVKVYSQELQDNYSQLALSHLAAIQVDAKHKSALMEVYELLGKRIS